MTIKRSFDFSKLPTGVKVGERTQALELSCRAKSKWLIISQALLELDATKTIMINLDGVKDVKIRVQCIKAGIKKCFKDMKANKFLRHAIEGNNLHIWVN